MPLVNEIGPIARAFGNILAAEPVSHGALTVIPLLAPMMSEPAWLTLVEAGDRVRITEVDEAGAVSQLKVANTADQAATPPRRRGAGRRQAKPRPQHHGARGGDVGADHSRELRRARALGLSRASLHAGRRLSLRLGAPEEGGLGDPLGSCRPRAPVRSGRRLGRARVEDRRASRGEPDRGDARLLRAVRGGDGRGAARAGAGAWTGGRARVPVRPLGGHGSPGWAEPLRPGLAASLRRVRGGCDRQEARRSPHPSPSAVLARLPRCPVEAVTRPVGLGAEYRLAGRTAGAALVADDRVAH